MSTADRTPTRPLASDRTLAVLLDDAFAHYRARLGLFLALAAAVVIPVELVVSGIGLGQLTSGFDEDPPLAALALTSGVSALVLVPLITVMVVRVLAESEEGRTPTAGGALRAGLDLFTPVLLVVLMVAAIVAVGLFALVVPGIIAVVHLSVVMQSMVVEGTRGTGALRRSWELVRGDAWWTLGVLVVTNLIASVLAAIVTLPGTAGAQEADLAVIGLVATIVAEIFTLSFLAVVNTLLFFSLRARKEGAAGPEAPSGWLAPPEEAPAPEPESDHDAFGRPAPRRDPDKPAWQPPPRRETGTGLPAPPPPPAEPPPAPGGWEPPRPGG